MSLVFPWASSSIHIHLLQASSLPHAHGIVYLFYLLVLRWTLFRRKVLPDQPLASQSISATFLLFLAVSISVCPRVPSAGPRIARSNTRISGLQIWITSVRWQHGKWKYACVYEFRPYIVRHHVSSVACLLALSYRSNTAVCST